MKLDEDEVIRRALIGYIQASEEAESNREFERTEWRRWSDQVWRALFPTSAAMAPTYFGDAEIAVTEIVRLQDALQALAP